MFFYNGKKFQPFAKKEELKTVFSPLSMSLKKAYPLLATMSNDEKEAILTGLVVKTVDKLKEDTRLAAEIAGLSPDKLKAIAAIFANGLALALYEHNSIDTEKVKNIAFEVMHTRLIMMAGKFKIYKVIKEPFRPIKALENDKNLKLFITAYNKF